MPSKVTYLIGAGASQNVHQLAKGKGASTSYSESLYQFVKDNSDYFHQFINNRRISEGLYPKYLDISEKCIRFGTPDTYAKWLYENNNLDEYEYLKRLISAYFTQHDHNPENLDRFTKVSEYRVLPFLTSIMEDGKIPDHIKIISWNYDSQFEIAARNYVETYKSHGSYNKYYLNGFSAWPNSINSFDPDYIKVKKTPFLIHLNGLAGFNYDPSKLADEFIAPFLGMAHLNQKPLLSYSWEDEKDGLLDGFVKHRLKLAMDMVEGTEYLVIIGYSFPFFNRKTDKMLLHKMSGTLQKIYYQEPNSDVTPEDLKNKFDLGIAKERIIMLRNTTQYHIPHEL
jgi:hypothetical protein